MATKKELAERWREPANHERTERLFDALERKASRQELAAILDGLPYAHEVPASLDLRGLEFRFGLTLSGLNLTGAHLEMAKLVGNIQNCVLVGAVLDGFEARNATTKGDFTRASFKRARLNGCWFDGSVLHEADFTRAWLEQASLRGCDCGDARFVDARVRWANFSDTIIEGADFSGADLTEAWLTEARFDERTRFEGATVDEARLDDDLARFVAGRAAPQGPELHGFALAELDATVNLLRKRNRDGHLDAVLARLQKARPTVARDPDFVWSTVLTGFPDEVVAEVVEALGEADVSEDT